MHTTRHRRTPDEPASKHPPGLFSHVFSFVSREFESFVVNATARPENQPISTGRTKSSGRRRARDSERNMSDDETRSRSRTSHRRQRERPCTKSEPPHPKPRSKSMGSRKCRRDHARKAYDDNDRVLSASDRERSTSPAPRPPSAFPVPMLPKLKKQPSITMPGSLFPRSPSLLPDSNQSTQATSVAPISVKSTRVPHTGVPEEAEAGPSWTYVSVVQSADAAHLAQPSLDQYVSPWRTRSVASVKDAVYRFNVTDGVEADFSLMLPSPHSSPAKPVSTARSIDEVSPQRLASNPVPTSPLTTSTSRKGKERAQDDDLDFIVGGGGGGVQAKERELDAAREEQREHERRSSGDQSRRASDEREHDKRRIRALEEEVRWLKEELSRSQARPPPPPSLAPPAPPPPPPPPPLPLRIDTGPCTPTSMFATARASLRHAMTPVEAPINNPGQSRVKRQGQPTVNVPFEKMAAFLHEIKTAKLRKVASGLNAMGGDGIAGPSGLSKSVSVTTSSASTGPAKLSEQELKRRRSLASLRVPIGSALAAPVPTSALVAAKEAEVRVGQKRKADALSMDKQTSAPPGKRRMMEFSLQSSSGTSQRTSASSSEISPCSSLSVPPRPPPTNETDVTTPSLCSDNDRDENSVGDPVPSTPPGPRTNGVAQKASRTGTAEQQIEVIDVDMEEQLPPKPRTISPTSVPRRTSDLFKKRPPTSPIPLPTPRRPSAPARTKRGATPKPKSVPLLESDGEEDRPLSQLAPVPFVSLIPVSRPKPTKAKAKLTLAGKGRSRGALDQRNSLASGSSGSGSSSRNKRKKAHKRRQTLDEELRTAEARSSEVDECNDELDPKEDEDVFTATGTRSTRRGFLAHGGGGGAPVFMGVGCVDGAVIDSEDEYAPRRLAKSSSQASLIPRMKART